MDFCAKLLTIFVAFLCCTLAMAGNKLEKSHRESDLKCPDWYFMVDGTALGMG